MRNIISFISNNKKIVIGIILAPIAVYLISMLLTTIFRIGTYLGTFLRYLYFRIVC